MNRKSLHTDNPLEEKFGYSRALRRGPFIFVSGTTSIDPTTGQILYPTSAYRQTRAALAEIIKAVQYLDGEKEDIVRIRMFFTAAKDTEEVGKGLKEMLGDVQPAATMIVGPRFVSSQMLVEIEADAVILR